MAIFKPESNGNYADFLGICEFAIMDFKDKSADFDWADIFIEVTVKQKGSDYDRPLQIKGSLERKGGIVTGGSVLKRMYHVFDQIGCSAGINVQGEWEDGDGNKIEEKKAVDKDEVLKGNPLILVELLPKDIVIKAKKVTKSDSSNNSNTA